MLWNNLTNSKNPTGKKIFAEDGTCIGEAITKDFAAYICQLHNNKKTATKNITSSKK